MNNKPSALIDGATNSERLDMAALYIYKYSASLFFPDTDNKCAAIMAIAAELIKLAEKMK